MSYEDYAYEYREMPNVEDVAVRPLDSKGEPKGEVIQDVRAIVHTDVSEGLNGATLVGGDSTRIVVFVDTLPKPVTLAPQAQIERANGDFYIIQRCALAVFGTRWICDCRKGVKRGV